MPPDTRYSKAEWTQICEDVTAILNDVQHVQGIPLGDGMGDAGTAPIINADTIMFNGIGEDAHEADGEKEESCHAAGLGFRAFVEPIAMLTHERDKRLVPLAFADIAAVRGDAAE